MKNTLLGIIISILILITGCSGKQVKSGVVSTSERGSIVQDLSDRSDQFNAFKCSSIIFFTPINTDKKLEIVGMHCSDLDPQEGLDRLKKGRESYLYKISGPGNEVWGYFAWIFKSGNIGTKLKDDKTLQIFYYPINRGK